MSSDSNEDSQGFSLRLREAMKGRSIREFASSASMSAGTLHNYLNDESLPTLDKLIALANTSDVSLNWLATGRGPVDRVQGDDSGESDEASSEGAKSHNLNVALLGAVLECLDLTVEKLDINMSAAKKSGVAVSIYDLYSELDEAAVNREKVFRLIESMID